MGTIVLADVTELNTVKLSELPQALSAGATDILPIVKDAQTQKIEKDNYLANSRFGDGINYSYFEADGKLHFVGDARPVVFKPLDSSMFSSTHHNPLTITRLDGMTAIGPTVSNNDRIQVTGINGGLNVKGRLKGTSFTQGDITAEGFIIKIAVTTVAVAGWSYSSQWRLELDINIGSVSGLFTVFLPPFNLEKYDLLEGYICDDGSVYFGYIGEHFLTWAAGSEFSTEVVTNVPSPTNLTCLVASTAGLYVGNKVDIADDSNLEVTRIASIDSNVSVTVVSLTNTYDNGTVNLTLINCVRSPIYRPIQRGLFKTFIFKSGVNAGVVSQFAIPHTIDPSEDIEIMFQCLPTEDNSLNKTVRLRIKYTLAGLEEDIPESMQYGEFLYSTCTPPATKQMTIHAIGAIPAASHAGKHALSFQLARLGSDVLDTYEGNVRLVAVVLVYRDKQLGYEA
jgi:hypothetical protein